MCKESSAAQACPALGSGCAAERALEFPASAFRRCCYYRPARHRSRLARLSPGSWQLLLQPRVPPAQLCAGKAHLAVATRPQPGRSGGSRLCRSQEIAGRAALRSPAAAGLSSRACSKLFLYFLILCSKVGGVREENVEKADGRCVFIIRSGGDPSLLAHTLPWRVWNILLVLGVLYPSK